MIHPTQQLSGSALSDAENQFREPGHYSLWLNERAPLIEAAYVSVRFAPGLFSFVDEPFPDFCDLK